MLVTFLLNLVSVILFPLLKCNAGYAKKLSVQSIENFWALHIAFDNAKKCFYWSFNAIFGKTCRIASENVVMQLIKSKCVPVLLYAVDACPNNRTLERSLQFPLTRIMMKIFKTNSKEIINNCRLYFGLQPISDAIRKRKINFLNKIFTTCNALCKLFVSTASSEIITVFSYITSCLYYTAVMWLLGIMFFA